MNRILFFLLFVFPFGGYAQLTDDFSDGDFSTNPLWAGDAAEFTVNATNQLQLNNTIAGASFLSTSNTIAFSNTVQWTMFVKQTFAPSSSNFGRVYLVSDQANLEGPLSGYYLQFGEAGSADAIELFKQVGTTSTSVVRGVNAEIAASFTVGVKVTRDPAGMWSLWVDAAGGTNYVLEGSGAEASIISTSFFGVATTYTLSNAAKFFYDDFLISSSASVDTTPPQLVSTTVFSANTLDVLFNEALDSASVHDSSHFVVNNGIGHPAQAFRDVSNQSLVHLVFNNPFTSGQLDSLLVDSILDLSSNLLLSDTGTFTYTSTFTPSYKDILINEIMADPTPVVALPNAEFIEVYNRSAFPINLNQWSFTDNPASNPANLSNYILKPDSFLILCSSASLPSFSAYSNVLGISSFPSLVNTGKQIYLKSNTGNFIDSVNYSDTWYQNITKAQGGWTLELINPNANSNCSQAANWIASTNVSGGTPGQQNAVFSNAPDITAPSVLSINAINSTQVSVCFSEAMDASQIGIASNYSVNNGIGAPNAVVMYNLLSCATLTFSNGFTSQIANTLSFTNLSDCSGNVINPATSSFTYFAPVVAGSKDVILTEIYSSPNLTSGLPNAEYVEIFNRSNNILNLNNWSFRDDITLLSSNLPNYILKPDSFVVLCASSNVPLFNTIANVIGVSSFPTLNNSGDHLYLRSDLGIIIDSVAYTDAWYQNAVKAQGGWSLELINPTSNSNCAPDANWIASTNSTGGTPGIQNSVFSIAPDITAPLLLSVIADDSLHVSICFNEAIDAAQIGLLSNYSINNGLNNPTSITTFNSLTCVTLTLGSNLISQQINTIVFSAIGDCSGNLVNPNSANFTYFAPVVVNPKDVIISEIYSSPSSSSAIPNAEYVELFNRSANPINLNNWAFHDDIAILSPNIGNYILYPDSFVVLCSSTNLSLFSGIGNIVGLSSFPSLNNTGDHIYLRSSAQAIVDSVLYSDEWYRDVVKKSGGWSLELINPNQNTNCAPAANWIASNNSNGGTPGKQNSVYSISPDITAPSIINAFAIDSVHISLCFSEAIDANQINNLNNYAINGGIGNPIGIVPNSGFSCVELNLANPLISQQTYTITLNSISDCSGNAVSPNTINIIYYTPVIASRKELIITEIYSSPTNTSGLPNAEYIELYNRSTKPINIGGWSLKDDTTGTVNITNYILFPDSFLILCGIANTALFSSNIAVFGINSFPSLNNTGDHIYLKNNLGDLVDDVNYSDTWYRNSIKKTGGWSLELIDRNFTCNNKLNWIASTNSKGGTPGKTNSVSGIFDDTQAPSLLRAIVTSNSSIKLFFDEPVNLSGLININYYTFNQGIVLLPGTVFTVNTDSTEVNIALPLNLQLKTIYTVTVNSALADCAGNGINPDANSAQFALWEEPEYNDVVVNEVLYDPISGGTDYIELYNRSDKTLDLSQLLLSSKDTLTNELKSTATIAIEGYLLFPGHYLLLSENTEAVKSIYTTSNPKGFWQMPNIPSLNISDGTIVLSTPQQKIIDDLHYYSSWQFPLLVGTKGVSLERINFNRTTQDASNWHSASQNVGFGTPAYRNSQYTENPSAANDEVTVDPEVFSPDNDGYQDIVNITYKTTNPGYTGSITIYDERGRKIRSLVKNELWGNTGTYSWDGITDDNDKARIGIYVVLVEVFDLSGNTHQYKKVCVLGAKL